MIRSVLARPGLWLLVLALVTLPFALALGRLEIRTDGEALYPAGSRVVEATLADRARFHDPEAIIVLMTAREPGARVMTASGFAFMRALTETLRTIPAVRSNDVLSIATLLDVSTSAERVQLARFLERDPSEPEARALWGRLARDPLYRGLLYANDGGSAAFYVPLVADAPRAPAVRRVRERLRAAGAGAFELRLTGPVVAETLLGEQILADLEWLVPIVVLVIAISLVLCLGQIGGPLTVLAGMLGVLVWTFGGMAIAGVPLTLVTSVLPVLLMAMAITDQVHLLERFQFHFATGSPRKIAVGQALAEVQAPIVRTSLTTAIGFLAFTTTSILPMRHFGVFAAFGLVVAMLFAFTLVPVMLLLLPEAWLRGRAGSGTRAPRGLERWAGAHPGRAALVAALMLIACLGGLTRLRVQDSWVRNFASRSDLAIADRIFNRDYLGSYRLDVTLASRQDEFFRRPEGVRALDSLQRSIARLPEIGGTRSLLDLAGAGLRGVDSSRTVASLDPTALAQLFLLLEMSGNQDQLDRFATTDGRSARIQCFVRGADYAKAKRVLAGVEGLRAGVESAGTLRMGVAGDLAVASEVVHATIDNQVRSIAVTLLALGIYLAFSFRSIAIAGILLLPVVATTLIVFGLMGYLAIPLGVATGMFAALAEGEGVDFSIHIASRYLEQVRHRSPREALDETLGTVGTAVRWNGIVVIAGVLVLCLSALRPVRALGALLALGLAVSYLTAFLALPALLLRLRAARPKTAPRAPAPVAATLLIALGVLVAPARAFAVAAEPREDTAAPAIMTAIESAQRAQDRILSMDIALNSSGYLLNRRILGVVRGGERATRIFYVVTAPPLFRGATLLLRDEVAPGSKDRMWFALPGLATLRELEATSLRLLIPGTGLTYEDSRGWIAPDKYRFTTIASGKNEVTLEARPRSDSLASLLGISRLAIRADPSRKVVLAVSTFDRAGTLVKTYVASSFVRIGRVWYPDRVRTEQPLQQLVADLTYRYRRLDRHPPEDLFRPEAGTGGFLDRYLEWNRRAGFAREFPDTLGGK